MYSRQKIKKTKKQVQMKSISLIQKYISTETSWKENRVEFVTRSCLLHVTNCLAVDELNKVVANDGKLNTTLNGTSINTTSQEEQAKPCTPGPG